jgi:hypothetical protein
MQAIRTQDGDRGIGMTGVLSIKDYGERIHWDQEMIRDALYGPI